MSLKFLIKFTVLKAIDLYQKTLSFDYGWFRGLFPGGYCKFQPTCSEYARQAIEKHGVWRGGLMALGRVFRCNPFSKGGHDPIK